MIVTSRIEGAHATLKAYLRTSTGDLFQVRKKISLVVMNQKKEIDTMIASEHIRFPAFVFNNSFYSNVRGMVSTYALKKVNEQYQKTNSTTTQEPLPPCTGSFLSTMGLPCAHYIQHFGIEENDTQDNEDMLEPPLRDLSNKTKIGQSSNKKLPQIVRTGERPSDSSNCQQTNLTRRDPSGFELVDHGIRN
ncbi:14551_t:CDS:2, partial [Gigaspora margarita]